MIELNSTDSCLENSPDREALQAIVYSVAELDTTEVTLCAYMQDLWALYSMMPFLPRFKGWC